MKCETIVLNDFRLSVQGSIVRFHEMALDQRGLKRLRDRMQTLLSLLDDEPIRATDHGFSDMAACWLEAHGEHQEKEGG